MVSPFLLKLSGQSEENDETVQKEDGTIDEFVERQYITFSWWLIHVGWRHVSERVKSAVEEVFSRSVSTTYYHDVLLTRSGWMQCFAEDKAER